MASGASIGGAYQPDANYTRTGATDTGGTYSGPTLTSPTISGTTTIGAGASLTAPALGAATATSLVASSGIQAGGTLKSVSSTGGVGYGTGAGGAVTQITNSATAVTLNTVTGQVTTVALTTAAGAEERFTVNNTSVVATDCIAIGTTYNGGGTPAISVLKVAANAFDVVITNLHASAALDAVVVINFAVIKAVAA